jgi:hypothetical protein
MAPNELREAENERGEMEIEPDELDYDAEGEDEDVAMAGMFANSHEISLLLSTQVIQPPLPSVMVLEPTRLSSILLGLQIHSSGRHLVRVMQ